MRLKTITSALHFGILLAALMLALPAFTHAADHIAPHGVTNFGASQLVVWYDESQRIGPEDAFGGNDEDGDNFESWSYLQVTNGSTDTAVNIHVQIFADDVDDSADRCREHNFTDTLTPTDTVIYVISSLDRDGLSASDPGGDNAGNPIAINVDETRGFILVTAVNQNTLPRQAISHNHLFGTLNMYSCQRDCDESQDEIEFAHGFNAMGRQAVDFTTGLHTPDGMLLDGITNGLRLLQPGFFFFSFNEEHVDPEQASVVSIAFSDTYSDPNGEYRAEPATAVWDPLMFDQFENGTSCQQHTQFCYQNIGLNDDWDLYVDDDGGYSDIRLCPAVSLGGQDSSGWVDIAVSGLSGLDNNLGLTGLNQFDSSAFAHWMHSQ